MDKGNNEKIRIREIELGEVSEQLVKLSADWAQENSTYGYVANSIDDYKGNRIFVLEIENVVVGYLYGHSFLSKNMKSIIPDETVCFEIEELFIAQKHRNLGYGKMLMEKVCSLLSDEYEYITLTTATKNYKAILHFYIDEMDMTFWSARLFKKISDDS